MTTSCVPNVHIAAWVFVSTEDYQQFQAIRRCCSELLGSHATSRPTLLSVYRDDKRACAASDRALMTTTLGVQYTDLSQFLSRLGETDQSAIELHRSQKVTALMDPEFHR